MITLYSFTGGAGGNYIYNLLHNVDDPPSCVNEYNHPPSKTHMLVHELEEVKHLRNKVDKVIVVNNCRDYRKITILRNIKRTFSPLRYGCGLFDDSISRLREALDVTVEDVEALLLDESMIERMRDINSLIKDHPFIHPSCAAVIRSLLTGENPNTVIRELILPEKLERLVERRQHLYDNVYTEQYIQSMFPGAEVVFLDYGKIFFDNDPAGTILEPYRDSIAEYQSRNEDLLEAVELLLNKGLQYETRSTINSENVERRLCHR